MNTISNHQMTSKLKAYRVVAVCVAASLMVGFSKPDQTQHGVSSTSAMPLGDWVAEPYNRPVPGGLSRAIGEQSSAPKIHVVSPQLAVRASRPSSLATDSIINPVLDRVNSRHWLDSSKYSPDLARAELIGLRPVTFHGVGFPDIRTDRKAKRFFSAVDADPTQWNQLVTWRESKASRGSSEPIALVQCMGLSPQAVARRADRYAPLIAELSLRYKVNPNLVKAVVTEESCFNNKALSHVGAQGLMQLMPETATWLKVKNPADPKDNLRGGVRYLSSLLKEFQSVELALAAYNAGPGNVRRYKGEPPFAETRAYLQKVKSNYRRYAAATRVAKGQNI